MYSSLVLKLAWNIPPSDSILQGHDMIVCLRLVMASRLPSNVSRVLSTSQQGLQTTGGEPTYSVLIVSLFLSLINEQVNNFCEQHSLFAVR